MFRSLCAPISCKKSLPQPKEEYAPITMTAIVLPIVIVVIIFIILSIFMYKKWGSARKLLMFRFSTPREDLQLSWKLD